LSADDKRNFEFEFDFGALLRGDEQTRYATYKEAIMSGFKTINECRQREGLEPILGGDVAYLQAQMTPITTLSNPQPAQTEQILGAMSNMDRELKAQISSMNNEKQPLKFDLNPNITVESTPINLTLKQETDGKPSKKTIKLVRDDKGNVTGAESTEG
jgi:hypothetical protein